MNFDDLKEQLTDSLRNFWDKVQESSIYITLNERYENLSPRGQKFSIASAIGIGLLLLLLSPMDAFFLSGEHVTEFETKRALVTRMQQAYREVAEGPNIPVPPESAMLESMVRQRLTSASLLPEQIIDVSSRPASGTLIPKTLANTALFIRLAKLNLRQILSLGQQFENLNQSVKMKDLTVSAGSNEQGYFDASFELVPLAVPSEPIAAMEPPSNNNPRNKARRGR